MSLAIAIGGPEALAQETEQTSSSVLLDELKTYIDETVLSTGTSMSPETNSKFKKFITECNTRIAGKATKDQKQVVRVDCANGISYMSEKFRIGSYGLTALKLYQQGYQVAKSFSPMSKEDENVIKEYREFIQGIIDDGFPARSYFYLFGDLDTAAKMIELGNTLKIMTQANRNLSKLNSPCPL